MWLNKKLNSTHQTQCDTSPLKRSLLVRGREGVFTWPRSCNWKAAGRQRWQVLQPKDLKKKKTTALLNFDLLWCSIVIFEYLCHPLYRCVYLFCFFDWTKPSFSSSIIEIKAVCAPPYFQFCNHPQLAHPWLPAFKMLICCHDQYVIIPHYSSLNLFCVLMKPCEHGVLELMTQEQKSFRTSFF